MHNSKNSLFNEVPVKKAVLTLAVPTIISQLITVVYNMADTFFIGQLNDPLQVAAATIAMPCFLFLTAFANLFGIGGSSLISRCLGIDDREKAEHTAAFCIWTGIIVAFLYGILIMILKPVIFPILGAKAETWNYLEKYIFWTVGIGSVPTVMNAEFAHLIRSEGYSKNAGFGVALGGILNIILDPLFIFVFKLEIAGAAIATMLSNLTAMLYFVTFLFSIRDVSVITLDPKKYCVKYNIPSEVITVGLPGFVMTFMSTVSNTALNNIVASYSNQAIAGMGIAKKIDLLAYAIAQGVTQGTLPLIGYNFSAGNTKRMKEAIKVALTYSIIVAACGTLFLYFLATPIVKVFIADAQTVKFGQQFLKIICLACPTTAINFMIITIFQAIGKKVQPLFLSMLRKGSIDIIFMLLLNKTIGISGIAWATPFADWTAFIISVILILPYLSKLNKMSPLKKQI